MKESLDDWLSKINCNAKIIFDNEFYFLSIDEIKSIYSSLNYWHGPSNPSTWLCESVVSKVKYKYKTILTRDKAMELSASILNMRVEKLEEALDWNANYMAWHDGRSVEDCHVWLKQE
ncbi:MAG: hypothetical protein PHW83_02025 [Bacteroidales bacterium]|nr:hypothetical protein [Bacteroidales bacterium]